MKDVSQKKEDLSYKLKKRAIKSLEVLENPPIRIINNSVTVE